ncbi:uncharacterized protein Tco025E_05774 [Trypanosoma conorhini]|uniref:Uncharacterized protein n=1 Tax=Trypanosoma conorhini TaxID=83891 RepID=A0A422PA36_9TRYP|nr:uncharacterized protein Tco025E_05774 [Trypanosoma conorhini]RNF14585.1 hypothetical protein Tco025E_05774 [Trypanosoma conorhini]
MAHAATAEDEIAAICRELDTLKLQLTTASPDSSASSFDGTAAAPHGGDDETGLRPSMEQLLGRLAQEQARRRQLEEELHALRMSQKQMTTESLEEISAKREELSQLTRERDEMRDWLQRGVNECRRVADEAIRLKRVLDERTQRCQLLETAKEELQEKIDTVQRQLADSQSQLEGLQKKECLLEACEGQRARSEQNIVELNEKRQKEYDALVDEAESRRLRAEELESAETCVQLLTERLQQLLTHMERLGQAVRKGCVEEVPADEFFLREGVAEPQHPLDELVARAQAFPRIIAAAIQQLHADIVAFMAEQRCLQAEQAAKQREHLEALHLEKQTLLHKYERERETLTQEIAQLRTELLRVVAKSPEDSDDTSNRQKERIAELEQLLWSNDQQAAENERLRGENDELRGKLRALKIDWKKVHESQLRFQELQVEVDMIARTNARIQKENESLKMTIETRFGQLPAGTQPEQEPHSEQLYPGASGRARGAALTPPGISSIMMNDTDGRRGASASPSASCDHACRSAEREAFQGWKRMVISGYLE